MISNIVVWFRFMLDRLRGMVYSLFLGKSGQHLRVDRSCFLSGLKNISIGDNVYLNKGCVLIGGGGISIGDNTLIAPYVQIYSEEHDKIDYKKSVKGKITIGKNCWICANAIILKGVTIPDNTIVPAGAIVTRGKK